MPTKEMSSEEIEQFIINARVGRLGLSLTDGPYIVPVGTPMQTAKSSFTRATKA